ncbi:leucoanthocyanidin dioxygenase-like [Typha latifolia]|uniref:leucoanthocyanidin dioxygenase-like n=1 Tax=Typha latifolia TaxID=4733 RepID=UPI003C2EA2A1
MATKVTTIARVESLAGLVTIPAEYIRPESEREDLGDAFEEAKKSSGKDLSIPVVDLRGFHSDDLAVRTRCVEEVRKAAAEWGVMHVVNHGIPLELIDAVKEAAEAFFELPLEEKEMYANDQLSGNVQGYGSKLDNNKCGKLEWKDYFFHVIYPRDKANTSIWPKEPTNYVLALSL